MYIYIYTHIHIYTSDTESSKLAPPPNGAHAHAGTAAACCQATRRREGGGILWSIFAQRHGVLQVVPATDRTWISWNPGKLLGLRVLVVDELPIGCYLLYTLTCWRYWCPCTCMWHEFADDQCGLVTRRVQDQKGSNHQWCPVWWPFQIHTWQRWKELVEVGTAWVRCKSSLTSIQMEVSTVMGAPPVIIHHFRIWNKPSS